MRLDGVDEEGASFIVLREQSVLVHFLDPSARLYHGRFQGRIEPSVRCNPTCGIGGRTATRSARLLKEPYGQTCILDVEVTESGRDCHLRFLGFDDLDVLDRPLLIATGLQITSDKGAAFVRIRAAREIVGHIV